MFDQGPVGKCKKAIRGYLDRSFDEILNDRALSLYGAALALTHVLTIFYWRDLLFTYSYLNDLKGEYGSICWSFAPWCRNLQLPLQVTIAIGVFYLALSVSTIALFYLNRARTACCTLLLITLLKYFLLLLDYRSMGNYHYMAFFMTLVFLFVPGRALACRFILLAIYFSAGLLKFNTEWLSGSALLHNPGVYGISLEWLCSYVVLLETCLVFGLFSHQRIMRQMTLVQLILFHAFSVLVVGYYYPLISACLLMIFPLSWTRPEEIRFRWQLVAVVSLFLALQMIPKLQSGDPSLVGRGRLYALNMLDANVECRPQFFIRTGSTISMTQELKVPNRQVIRRIKCDPLVFWNIGRDLCRRNSKRTEFAEIDFLLTARRSSDPEFKQIASVPNFCRSAISYSTFFPNDWNQSE